MPMKGRLMSVSISPGAIAVADIGLVDERVPPSRFDGLESLLGAVVLRAVVDADRRAGPRHPLGDRAADASRRAGHQGHPAGQIDTHRELRAFPTISAAHS